MKEFLHCTLCPRHCGVDRTAGNHGICGETAQIRLARAALHMWEEPCISGKSGSGAVFFSGCAMHCVFCQNAGVANGNIGKAVSQERLAEIFLQLQNQGANNINLVTPDHYVPVLAAALKTAKSSGLVIPVVYNTSAYVEVDTLRMLEGLVDIYLPDFKYYRKETAKRYARAEDYPKKAKKAIAEMVRQTGRPEFFEKGSKRSVTAEEWNDLTEQPNGQEILMKKGTIVRHLLLPQHLDESRKILKYLIREYGTDIYISILNQYTPVCHLPEYPELNRRITGEEYETIVEFAIQEGIENGFIQEGDTAEESFIPEFDYEGV